MLLHVCTYDRVISILQPEILVLRKVLVLVVVLVPPSCTN
jgi:hypothetical protein